MDFLENCIEDGGLRKKKIFKSSKKQEPLITVITTVLNSEKYLQECFDSLHKQKYQNIEHIVIDGGSTDNSLNIIKKKMKIKLTIGHQKKIKESMTHLISE